MGILLTDATNIKLGEVLDTIALTCSRISRALSSIIKMLAFTSLASVSFLEIPALAQGSLILATIAVGFCLLRGLPFFSIDFDIERGKPVNVKF